jgi:hypothetical protein
MKILLLCGLVALALPAAAQIPGRSIADYTTRTGTLIHKGDTLHFGLGTDIGGLFKYAYIPPNYLIGLALTPFNSQYANTTLVVKDLRVQDKSKRMAPRTLAVVRSTLINGVVELDAAEESGEIRTVNNRPKSISAPAPAPAGIADELLKLKSLLDAKAITQQEYDAQKGKLLSR